MEASDDEDADDGADWVPDDVNFACLGRDIQQRAWDIKEKLMVNMKRDDPCPALRKDDTLYRKDLQMDVGRVTRFAATKKYWLNLAKNVILLDEQIPDLTPFGVKPLTARERLSCLGMYKFAEIIDELFIQVLLSPKKLTRAMLEKGEASLAWLLRWHLMFNPALTGNVFKSCIHRYHIQGLFGVMRGLRMLLQRCEKLNTKWEGRLKCFVRFKPARGTNSPTESGFCELRVCAGFSVLDGVRLKYLFPQMLGQEIRGHRRLKFTIKRAEYFALQKTIERMYGPGED